MSLNNNNSLLKFTLIGLSLSLSGLIACMFFQVIILHLLNNNDNYRP
jgi:hypothetical protein